MKRILKKLFIACIGLILFASCEELTLSETDFNCPAKDSSFCFEVKSRISWTATVSDTSWLKLSQDAGNGDALIYVYVTINKSFSSPRYGSIEIRTANNFYIVNITQQPAIECGDLGLSVEWATCNIGASNSDEFGDYYLIDQVDKLSNQEWRVPTKEEWRELMERCDWSFTNKNGVKGLGIFSKKTGNGIFLPKVYMRDWWGLYGEQFIIGGHYWSCSHYYGSRLYCFSFYETDERGDNKTAREWCLREVSSEDAACVVRLVRDK